MKKIIAVEKKSASPVLGAKLDLDSGDFSDLNKPLKKRYYNAKEDQILEVINQTPNPEKNTDVSLAWQKLITNQTVIFVMSRFANLTSLNLEGTNVTGQDDLFLNFSQFLPKLERINLKYCTGVTQEDIDTLSMCYQTMGRTITIEREKNTDDDSISPLKLARSEPPKRGPTEREMLLYN